MVTLKVFLKNLPPFLSPGDHPWEIVKLVENIVTRQIRQLGADFVITSNVAIHKRATIEQYAIIKGPAIISEGCFIAAHAYLRGGVFLADNVVVGPGTEVKGSFVMNDTALAHFNFIGDSVLGSFVNMEAGSVIANHFNERADKRISIRHEGKPMEIPSEKFGAMVGDGCRIGANAVLSPGTLLPPGAIVKRLEHIQQFD